MVGLYFLYKKVRFLKVAFILIFLSFYFVSYTLAQQNPVGLSGWVLPLPLASGSRKVKLEWEDSGVSQYRIFRCSTQSCIPDTEINESPTSNTEVETGGLNSETWYTFKVQDATNATPDEDAINYGIYIPKVRLKWEEYVE